MKDLLHDTNTRLYIHRLERHPQFPRHANIDGVSRPSPPSGRRGAWWWVGRGERNRHATHTRLCGCWPIVNRGAPRSARKCRPCVSPCPKLWRHRSLTTHTRRLRPGFWHEEVTRRQNAKARRYWSALLLACGVCTTMTNKMAHLE
jgi:hypothetical protein